MIDITCKCVYCGKTWQVAVDEHDYERYLPGKQFTSRGKTTICSCDKQPMNIFPKIVMDTVCCCCEEKHDKNWTPDKMRKYDSIIH